MAVNAMEERLGSRVMIVAPNEAVREGLMKIVERGGDVCVGKVEGLHGAAPAADAARPDVTLIDHRLRSRRDIQACRDIANAAPASAMILLSSYVSERDHLRALLAGVSACILKQVRSGSYLTEAIARARARESLVAAQLQGQLARLLDVSSHLHDGERRLLGHLAHLRTDYEIADATGWSPQAVRNAIGSLGQVLRIHD